MMLRFIAFFLLFTVSLGGVPASAADPVYPLGSRTGFVPPPGFVASKRFPGFEHADSKSSMLVATLPAEAYGKLEESLSPDALKKQGIVEVKRETLALADGKALLVTATEEDKEKQKFRKWMLLGQVKDSVAMVAVLVPESGTKTFTDDMIHKALATIKVRDSIPMEEQLSLMPFKLNDMSGLHPVRVFGNTGVILTYGDKPSAQPTDQPFFAVQIGQGGPDADAGS
jgi:hypothetical protein